MHTDRVFVTAGDWAVASDGIQWILQRRRMGTQQGWRPLSFVRSERDILARCMREKGVDVDTANLLLSGLPDTFDQWKASQSTEEVCSPLSPMLSDIALETLKPLQKHVPVYDQGPFDRLRGDATLSTWKPTGNGAGMPDIPEFLRRT